MSEKVSCFRESECRCILLPYFLSSPSVCLATQNNAEVKKITAENGYPKYQLKKKKKSSHNL